MGPQAAISSERFDSENEGIPERTVSLIGPENVWLQRVLDELSSNPFEESADDCSIIFRIPSSIKRMSPDHFKVQGIHLGLQNRYLNVSGPPEICKMRIAQVINLELQYRGKSWDAFVRHVVPDPAAVQLLYEAPNKNLKLAEIQYLLTLDALFLVVFFQHRGNRCATSRLSTLMSSDVYQRQLPSSLQVDLVLVENQVPMEILVNVATQLCEMEGKDDVEEAVDLMLKEAILFLHPFMHGGREEFMVFLNTYYSSKCRSLQTCDHILDCVYRVVCHYDIPFPGYVKPTGKIECMKRISSATTLRKKGIRFEGTASTMRDVCFSSVRFGMSATLILPQIKIFDHTVPLLRNVAVYEQIANNHRCPFRGYLLCMSHLIDKGDDVRLLSECGVIFNSVGNNDSVSAAWSKICDGIIVGVPEDKWCELYHSLQQHNNRGLKLGKELREVWRRRFCM